MTSDPKRAVTSIRAHRRISPGPTLPAANVLTIAVVDRRVLLRECLVRCLKNANENCAVLDFATVAEWQGVAAAHPATVIILCTQDGDGGEAERELAYLSQEGIDVPVVVVSDAEDSEQILSALENGARGYIPTSMSLDVAVRAMRLVEAGGTFVPASTIIATRRRDEGADVKLSHLGTFTARQAAVLEGLRQGKANKQIAYELNMSEGTVKVHVRNIMRKLKARNRTEVAFLISSGPAATSEP
jgi:DNA-binding NarL/FixJ family response regulator